MNAQPCPHCGLPVLVLPSGQVTTPAVVIQVADLLDAGDEVIEQIMGDPDLRAVAGEFIETELLDPDED